MTLTRIPGGREYFPPAVNSFTAWTITTLDAAGEYFAFVCAIPATGTLKKAIFRTRTVTTADDIAVTIETVNASGDPTGTLYTPNASGTYVISDTDDEAGLYVNINGATGVSVTAGDLVAIKVAITYVNGNMQFYTGATLHEGLVPRLPYLYTYLGGVATKNTTSRGIVGLEITVDGVTSIYTPPGCVAPQGVPTVSTVADTYVGNRFILPYPVTVSGFWVNYAPNAPAEVILYDSDGATPLATWTAPATTTYPGTTVGRTEASFSTPVNLLANTYYRIVLKGTTAVNKNYYEITYTDDGSITGVSGAYFGESMLKTAATTVVNEASWTQTPTQRVDIGLIYSHWDVGGSSGIKCSSGGLNGGMQ